MSDEIELETNETPRLVEKAVDVVLHESMIPYAEAVILDRAIPRVEDGLKPVQRRILYSMYDLGITSDKPHKKSARIVGECLGKYHPHGDTSVYDALVRMAQPFNMGEVLVDGHGNFGSVDGDGAAAMRYTEARLAPIADEMLRDIEKDTVPFSFNFDDTLKEPDILPCRFPNILVNGSMGIAVGISTSIPTHNITEVIDGTIALIDSPHMKLDELMNIIKGPDFPTGGFYAVTDDLRQAYSTGKGKITLRSKIHIERDGDKKNIVITEFPYQVNKAKVLQKIEELRETKKEPYVQIADILDESDRNGTRATIKLKRDADPNRIIKLLLKHTDLQINVYFNMVAIADGKPRQMGLIEMLKYYIAHQRNVILKRTRFDLNAAKDRDEVLRGLLVAIQNIDEVISIIKSAKNVNDAKEKLRSRFALSEKQSHAIVEMKLRRLTNLETDELISEIEDLRQKIEWYTKVLGSIKVQNQVIKDELNDIKKHYKKARQTAIVSEVEFNNDDVSELKPNEAPQKPTVNGGVVLFKNGTIKFCNQRTLGSTAKSNAVTSEDDIVDDIIYTTSDKVIYAFTDKGNVARISVANIPEKSWKDKGVSFLKLVPQADKDEKIVSILLLDEEKIGDVDPSIVFLTSDGMAKRSLNSEYTSLSKTYFQALNLKEGESVLSVSNYNIQNTMLFVTRNGMVLNAELDDVPLQGRKSSGVKGIALADDDSVVSAYVVDDCGELICVTEMGYGKRIILAQLEPGKRYRKGVKIIDTDLAFGKVIFADVVKMPYMVVFFFDNGTNEAIFSELVDVKHPQEAGKYLPLERYARILSVQKHKTM